MVERKEMEQGRIETVPLDRIKPYWRNPRKVTEENVNRLAESIKAFGYQQPIVVDEDYVIIVGHTRYAALRRLDVREVPVRVASDLTPEEAKQYRLIDNRVAEHTSWDFDKLTEEIGKLDAGLIGMFFPEIDIDGAAAAGVESPEDTLAKEWDRVQTSVDFVCPSCFHSWQTEVTREAVMAGVIGRVPS